MDEQSVVVSDHMVVLALSVDGAISFFIPETSPFHRTRDTNHVLLADHLIRVAGALRLHPETFH